jgi:hypothetical protein
MRCRPTRKQAPHPPQQYAYGRRRWLLPLDLFYDEPTALNDAPRSPSGRPFTSTGEVCTSIGDVLPFPSVPLKLQEENNPRAPLPFAVAPLASLAIGQRRSPAGVPILLHHLPLWRHLWESSSLAASPSKSLYSAQRSTVKLWLSAGRNSLRRKPWLGESLRLTDPTVQAVALTPSTM